MTVSRFDEQWARLVEGSDPRTNDEFDRLQAMIEAGEVGEPSRNGTATSGEDDYDAPTWYEIDLAPVLAQIEAGEISRPVPTVGRISDGRALFYLGRVNGLHGIPACGKTWVVLLAASQELADGRHVFFIDYEDDEFGTVARLLDMGTAASNILERFHYLRPDELFGLVAQERLFEAIQRHEPTLAIIDSIGESMAVENIKPNDDDAVARWFRMLPRKIARLGPAVVSPDHVVKDKEAREHWAIGSQRKGAAVTGASYSVEAIAEFAKGRKGRAKLVCAKDRPGNYHRGQRVAELVVDSPEDGPASVQLVPAEVQGTGTVYRPTFLMERVSRYVELHPGESKNSVVSSTSGKKTAKEAALACLIAEGFVRVEKQGQAHCVMPVSPFREDMERDEVF